MQHGHPSLSTVHHHSALSAWKKLAQYVAQGSRGGRVPDRRPADLRRRRLLRPPRPRPPGPARRHRDLRGRRLERRRGAAQPDLRRRARRPRPPAGAPLRRPPRHAARARLRGPPAAQPGRVVGVVTPSPLARRAARRGASASASCSPSPAGSGCSTGPPTAPRRWRAGLDQLTLRASASPSSARPLAGWWTRLAGGRWSRPGCSAGWRRRSSACGPAAGASWPGRRRSPSGPRCCRDLLVSNAGLHEAIGKSARVAPAAIRDEVQALYVRAQRGDLVGGARPASPTTWTTPSPTPSSPRCRSPTSGPCPTSARCSPPSPRRPARPSPCSCASTPRGPAPTARPSSSPGSSPSSSACSSLTNRELHGAVRHARRAGRARSPSCGLVAVAVWAMVVLSRPARAERLLRVGAATAGRWRR